MDIDVKLLEKAIKNKDLSLLKDYDDSQIMAAIDKKNEHWGQQNMKDAAALYGTDVGARMEREYRESGGIQTQGTALSLGAKLTGNDTLIEATSNAAKKATEDARKDALNPSITVDEPTEQFVQASMLGGGESQSNPDYVVPDVKLTETKPVVEEKAKEEEKVVEKTIENLPPQIVGGGETTEEIANNTLSNIQALTDRLYTDDGAKEALSVIGKSDEANWAKDNLMTIRQLVKGGYITKEQQGFLIMNSIATALSNISANLLGQPANKESLINTINYDSLKAGIDRATSTKKATLDTMIDRVKGIEGLQRDVYDKVVNTIQDTNVQKLLTRFGEEKGLRVLERLIENVNDEGFQDLMSDPAKMEQFLQLGLMAGEIGWQEALAKTGVSLSDDLLGFLKDVFGLGE